MQKITYVNAYGEAIVFSGENPVLLRSVSGLSRPEALISSVQGAYQHGAVISRMQLPMRSVEVRFDILPQESREAFYAQRMRIERVLASSRAMREGMTGVLVYENDAGRWQADAVPEGSIAYGRRTGNAAADNRIGFICPNPYFFGSEAESVQLRMGSGGLSLPSALPLRLGSRRFDAEIVNRGTADAPVTITVFGTGEMPTVINHTTGAKITVSRQVATGEKLVICTQPNALSCTLIRKDGTKEDAFAYLDPSSAVSAFALIPGTNAVEYVPGAASTQSRGEIAWRNCYEGV